jgi:hypothetical protein
MNINVYVYIYMYIGIFNKLSSTQASQELVLKLLLEKIISVNKENGDFENRDFENGDFESDDMNSSHSKSRFSKASLLRYTFFKVKLCFIYWFLSHSVIFYLPFIFRDHWYFYVLMPFWLIRIKMNISVASIICVVFFSLLMPSWLVYVIHVFGP